MFEEFLESVNLAVRARCYFYLAEVLAVFLDSGV